MRIISEKHDYYDCIQRSGIDTSLAYIRKEIVEEHSANDFPIKGGAYCFSRCGYRTRSYGIGFCGKYYLCFEISIYNKETMKNDFYYAYDLESFDKICKSHLSEKDYKHFRSASRSLGFGYNESGYNKVKKYFNRFQEYCKNNQSKMFEKYPVYLIYEEGRTNKIIWNYSNLKSLEFFRIFDPYSAYQEIQMFLGSLASPEKEIPEMSNELKIHQKGLATVPNKSTEI